MTIESFSYKLPVLPTQRMGISDILLEKKEHLCYYIPG